MITFVDPIPGLLFRRGFLLQEVSNIVNHSDIYCSVDKIARFHGSSTDFENIFSEMVLPILDLPLMQKTTRRPLS